MTEFKECYIDSFDKMLKDFAYMLDVEFYNIESSLYNNFISESKCIKTINARSDNGRIMYADYIRIRLTDIDLEYILKSYNFKNYKILKSYYSSYNYLPIDFVNFILDKYVEKTKFKGLTGYEVQYAKSKNRFNSLYGMTVTNTICDEVQYNDLTGEWFEKPLENSEIENKLQKEKNKAFLSFQWGVWTTAIARRNLIMNVIKQDKYAIYCDTDSIKLRKGYDKKVIDDYNEQVVERLKHVSQLRNIPFEKFEPEDKKGVKHLLGVFDYEGSFDFITQRC